MYCIKTVLLLCGHTMIANKTLNTYALSIEEKQTPATSIIIL